MCMAYLVVFRYFGCFWSSNRGKTEHEVRMPNDVFSKNTLSQPRSHARGRWTIQSRLHCISLDRKTEPLKSSLINDILDHWEAHFSPSDANDIFGRGIMT
ncbi:unnamed protein product [Arabidopsis thaliana]|uniref:Uncharacterized protein n=1 Tax=Arabidopsis thaliana TaxID=3702 RepID=Q9LSK6_ARATH|nr:unnamed protein product [Arabidopsis thaliana]